MADKVKQPKEIDVFNRFSNFNKLKIIGIGLAIALVICTTIFFLAKIFSSYTISFETYGGLVYGEPIKTDTYKFLEKTREPVGLKKEGYYIEGYYTDAKFTNKFEFGKRTWNSKKLYVNWQEGYAVQLFFAEGEDTNERPSTDTTGIDVARLKLYHEQYVKPGSEYTLPLIYNDIQDNEHYGEQLYWNMEGDLESKPFATKTFTVSDNIKICGTWFDTAEDKFAVTQEGVLTRYLGECANVVLPSKVKKIKDIEKFTAGRWNVMNTADGSGYSAFDKVYEKLDTVIIGSEFQELGSHSFRNCSKLNRVYFEGNKIHTIGEWAFVECGNLVNLELPNSVRTIEDRAFYKSGIKTLTGLNNLESIGYGAFMECVSLKELELRNIATIDSLAFAGTTMSKLVLTTAEAPDVNMPSDDQDILWGNFVCKIYVPEAMLEDYSNKYPWSIYHQAGRVLAITE